MRARLIEVHGSVLGSHRSSHVQSSLFLPCPVYYNSVWKCLFSESQTLGSVVSEVLAAQRSGVAHASASHSPVECYLGRLKPDSRRTQQAALDQIAGLLSDGKLPAEDLSWHLLTPQQTHIAREKLAARYVPTTANRMISAFRAVLKEVWKLNLMDAEAYHRASALENVPWSTPPRGRTLSQYEIRALFQACARDVTPAGSRDAALLTVLYSAGLRRSEAASLDFDDYDVSSGGLTVRGMMRDRERTLYAVAAAAQSISGWIGSRGSEPGALFVPIDKGQNILVRHERMREQSIYRAMLKRAEQAGVESFSCQDLRRTFITRLLEGGADISTVQRLAGHCSVTTTQRYDRRPDVSRQRLGQMLPVPSARVS